MNSNVLIGVQRSTSIIQPTCGIGSELREKLLVCQPQVDQVVGSGVRFVLARFKLSYIQKRIEKSMIIRLACDSGDSFKMMNQI